MYTQLHTRHKKTNRLCFVYTLKWRLPLPRYRVICRAARHRIRQTNRTRTHRGFYVSDGLVRCALNWIWCVLCSVNAIHSLALDSLVYMTSIFQRRCMELLCFHDVFGVYCSDLERAYGWAAYHTALQSQLVSHPCWFGSVFIPLSMAFFSAYFD